jgi:hypothetical protein
MKKLILPLLLVFTFFYASVLHAQDWVSQMHNPAINFFEVQKTFNKTYSKEIRDLNRKKNGGTLSRLFRGLEETDEIPGFNQFKRWEWFMAPRVSPSGERFSVSKVWEEMTKYNDLHKASSSAGNWSFIGPTTTSNLGGAGRLNFVRIDPTNSNIIYVGSPSGGLWKSTNAGTTWFTNTDFLNQVIGCTDIAIDPTNSNILYMATGDGDAGDTYSVGILKSIDGGATWFSTGLSFQTFYSKQISKLLINPSNSNSILVATSDGIFRSIDASYSFTQVQAGNFKDLEYKPGDTSTVYACGTEFYKSTNGGQTWSNGTTGLPPSASVSRMAIATSTGNSSYIYMIVGLPYPNYGTEGFYKSINNGVSFTKISTPSIGNQQWYDLAIASSPTNSQEVVIGGQAELLKTTNGGLAWTNISGITHVDYHDLVYTSANSIYCVNDGGIYHSTNGGGAWTILNNNLAISQLYGFGQGSNNANLFITGWQDNGTNYYNGIWNQGFGGDGMLPFISYSNNSNMWGSAQNGDFRKSTNGGNNWSLANTGITETGNWVTPWMEDPLVANTLWAGFENVWKSTNGGTSWTKKSTFPGIGRLNCLMVSKANNAVIWASRNGELFKTSTGGNSWTAISALPSGNITAIACSNTDVNKAWITYSGFSSSDKVYQTNDQGVTWINISNTLPNIPINCITYLNNSNDALYIGTDAGVYFKDNTTTIWQPFFNGLPNVIVTQLSVYYPTGKLRASTYGRGLWESNLYTVSTSVNVTLSVNMSNQTVSPSGVHVAGSFNNWDAAFTSLAAVGNGVYETTLSLTPGFLVEYKFINGTSFTGEEIVPSGCGVSNGLGGYNRNLTVPGSAISVPTTCFSLCSNCSGGTANVAVTFRVNMTNENVSANGIHLAGTFNNWNATANQMTSIGNGVYETILFLDSTSVAQYKFLNGNNFSGEENVPASCGVSNGLGGYNRNLVIPQSALALNTICFSSCSNCSLVSNLVNVSFRINMSNQNVSTNGVHLAGSFNNWNASTLLMNPIGAGVYEAIVSLDTAQTIQYKFINGTSFSFEENVPANCGVSNGLGGYNRFLAVPEINTLLNTICFSSCTNCSGVGFADIDTEFLEFGIEPSFINASAIIFLTSPKKENASIELFSIDGKKVKTIYSGPINSGKSQFIFNSAEYSAGPYSLIIRTESGFKSQKIIISK